MDAKKIKRRRHHGGHHLPGRLGWLGDGLRAATTTTTTGNDDDANDHGDSDAAATTTTHAAADATLAHDEAAIDLTGDNNNNNNDDDGELVNGVSSQASHSSTSIKTINEAIFKNDIQTRSTDDNDKVTSEDGWVCQACTLINTEKSSTCEACNTKRGRSLSDRRNQQRRHSKSSIKFIKEPLKSSTNDLTNNNRASLRTSSSNTAGTKRSVSEISQSSSTRNTAMWIDKYAPTSSHELCVAPKKVEQVRNFLSSYIDYIHESRRRHQQQQQQSHQASSSNGGGTEIMMTNSNHHNSNTTTIITPPETKLMILIGNPGVGKSAMVRTLAMEMNLQILSWNDAHVEYNNNHNNSSSTSYLQLPQNDDGLGSGSGYYYDALPYQSQLNSFDEFLTMSGAGMQSLDIVGGGDADATVAMMTTPNTVDLPRGRNGRTHKLPKKTNNLLKKDEQKMEDDVVGSVILVEEIPNLYNAEAALSFRNIMERHIQRTQIPTIFIYSDVHEGNHRPEDLERLFPIHLLNSPSVQMVPIHPVTKSKMKKCLQSIANAELTEKGGGSYSPSAVDYEDMHLASGGDLRHAIFAMQFRYCCSSRSITTSSVGRTGHDDDGNDSSTKKDAKLSTFHALGKLLYAKRKQQPSRVVAIYSDDEELTAGTSSNPATTNIDILSKWDDGRDPLEFIPEDVLSRIDMGIGPALSFLSYHSPDFFTDISDMCRSYDLLSDAVLFVDRFTGQQGDGPFPDEYASCIGGRAVADANKHPAPPQFRQLSAPKVFSVMKKSRENEAKIELLRKRLSMVVHNGGGGGGQERTSIHNTIGSAHQFITDSLPYMRTVIPQDVNFALANLHSLAKHSIEHAEPQNPEDTNYVLLEDDLVDDD